MLATRYLAPDGRHDQSPLPPGGRPIALTGSNLNPKRLIRRAHRALFCNSSLSNGWLLIPVGVRNASPSASMRSRQLCARSAAWAAKLSTSNPSASVTSNSAVIEHHKCRPASPKSLGTTGAARAVNMGTTFNFGAVLRAICHVLRFAGQWGTWFPSKKSPVAVPDLGL